MLDMFVAMLHSGRRNGRDTMNKNIATAITNFVAMHHAGVTVTANGENALFPARTQ